MAPTAFKHKLLNLHETSPRKRPQNLYCSPLKYSKVSLSDIDAVIKHEVSAPEGDANLLAEAIVDALTLNYEPTSSNASIIFYISGAIAKSIVRATKCNVCKESLIVTKICLGSKIISTRTIFNISHAAS